MNLILIICLLIAICDGGKTRRTDFTTEPIKTINSLTKTQSKENSETIENHEMPNIETEDESAEDSDSTYIRSTRRPLMKKIKFTSKPHAVHYIPSITHGQQVNFSKRKNSRHQNKNKNNSDKYVESDSLEDRFKTFTDADDLEQTNRKFTSNRHSNRRRGHPLVTAASEQLKRVAPYTFNSNKYRSKSKSAIAESLKNNLFKTIRPGMKEKTITSNTILTKVKNNVKGSLINDTDINKTTTQNPVQNTITTEKLLDLKTIADKVIYEPVTTDNSNITRRKISLFDKKETENSDNTKTIAEKLNDAPTIAASTLSRLESSVSSTENSDNAAVLSEKSMIPIHKFHNLVPKADIANHPTGAIVNLHNETDKFGENAGIKLKSSVNTEAAAIKSDSSINATEDLVQRADVIEISDSKTQEKVPIIIVTAKSISINNSTVEAFTNRNIIESEETSNSRLNSKTEENIMTVTPISNGEEIVTTEGVENHFLLRRKRHINIIEEERAATTSTGFRFNGREVHTDTDVTYRNIHT